MLVCLVTFDFNLRGGGGTAELGLLLIGVDAGDLAIGGGGGAIIGGGGALKTTN